MGKVVTCQQSSRLDAKLPGKGVVSPTLFQIFVGALQPVVGNSVGETTPFLYEVILTEPGSHPPVTNPARATGVPHLQENAPP